MSNLKYSKPERISLKGHPELNERWVQERIAEDPALLGLGDLILKDKERIHPQELKRNLRGQFSRCSITISAVWLAEWRAWQMTQNSAV